jgi:lysozyme
MSKAKLTALAGSSAALAASIVAPVTLHHEGMRLKAYLDPVGIPTICVGETQNVRMGDVKTEAECNAMFEARLGYFAYRVDALIDVQMHPYMHAALTSFTYNVGTGAFKNSTLRRKLNSGDYVGACNELPRWNKAGGKVWNGLIKRRDDEKNLCLQGAYEMNRGVYEFTG